MAKTILVTSGTPDVVAAGATEYFETATTNLTGRVEAQAQVVYRTAGTFSGLWVRVTANATTAASTVRLRVNGSNVTQTISIPAGGAGVGVFEDTTHTDTITAGQSVCYQVTAGTGGAITIGILSTLFSATTDTVSKLGIAGGQTFTVDAVSRYNQLSAEITNSVAVESSGQTMIRTAGMLKNLQAFVISNARTTASQVRIRKNGANGNSLLTVNAGITNTTVEDTVNSDTVAVGDLVDFVIVTGTGTAQVLNMSHILIDFITTDGKGIVSCGRTAGFAQPEPATNNPYIGGNAVLASTATEANTQIETRANITFSQMSISVTANTVNAASTLRFRKNGVDGNQLVSIGSSGTGFLFDNTNTDVCDLDDLVNLQLITPSVAGTQTMTVRNFALVYSIVDLTSVSQTNIQKYNLLQYVTGASVQKYNLLQYITQASIQKYHILTSLVQASIHKYNLLVNIAQSNIHKYSLLQFATQSSVQKYSLVQYIAQNSIQKYQVLVNILQDSIHKYSLLTYVSQNSIHKYSLLANALQSSIQKYRTLAYATQVSIQKYNVIQNVLNTSIQKYTLLQNILQSSVQKYSIIQNILQSSIQKYSLLQNVLQQSIQKYDIIALGAVIANTIQKYNLLQYVSATPSTQKYHILNYVTKSTSHLYNILTNVLQTSVHKYNLETLGAVIASTIHAYDIRQYIQQSNIQKYYILNYIFAEGTHAYYILQYILQTSIHRYDILSTLQVSSNEPA